jgi:hypothetical protein
MPSSMMMRYADASLLADRLLSRGVSPSVADQIALMQAESQLAGRLIKAMLRQVHSSDVFQLPPEE